VSRRRWGILRDGVEIQSEVCEAIGSLAGARRVGLWSAGLQTQVSDFRMAPRCVAASLVAEAQVGSEKLDSQVLGFSAGILVFITASIMKFGVSKAPEDG
jgi:hypothetical protein